MGKMSSRRTQMKTSLRVIMNRLKNHPVMKLVRMATTPKRKKQSESLQLWNGLARGDKQNVTRLWNDLAKRDKGEHLELMPLCRKYANSESIKSRRWPKVRMLRC